MHDITERVSYLQGLSEGLNIREGSPQGKIISGILSVLDEIADSLLVMEERLDELQEFVESMDNDLQDLEEKWDEEPGVMDEIRCSHCGELIHLKPEIWDDEDVMEIICPYCDEVVFVNDGSFDYQPSFIGDEKEINEEHSSPNPSL